MLRTGEPKPIFLDEENLQRIIIEGLHGTAGRIAKAEGMQYNKILHLCLGHRHILKINHLWEFTSLTKLELNNNLLRKIDGLDRLTRLTWLNLSFNNIERIEGLESLHNLELLNLSNNRISVIENMSSLEKLTHFRISNNLISQQDNVLYLTKFEKLFAISIFGNPVTEKDNFKVWMATHFPNLKFFDNKPLHEEKRSNDFSKYLDPTEESINNDPAQTDEEDERQEADLQLQTDAFVEFLNGPHLFQSMFNDDPDADKLWSISEVPSLLLTYEQEMEELCVQLFEIGLTEHGKRETELKSFLSGQSMALADYHQKAAQTLADFDDQHSKRTEELQQLSDPEQLKVKLEECKDKINMFLESLMMHELQLVSGIEDSINMFNTNITDMVTSFTKTASGIFTQCRDLEDGYHEKLQDIFVTIVEKVANGEFKENLPEDVKGLFKDKDTVMDVLTTSHEKHLQRINYRETQLVARILAWKTSLVKGIEEKQLQRNSMCVSDIPRYGIFLMEQLEEFQ